MADFPKALGSGPAPKRGNFKIFRSDESDGPTVLDLVPPKTAEHMRAALEKRPDLFSMDEKELKHHLRHSGLTPTPTDNRLRIMFWQEYDRAMAHESSMQMNNVYAGVCTHGYFHQHYLPVAEKVAWLLCPPADYVAKIAEVLDYGLDRMREILEMPLTDPVTGKFNGKLAELQAKITFMMDMRKHGAFTQKIEQKNMSLSITARAGAANEMALDNSMDELDKRLKELEKMNAQAQNLIPGPEALGGETTSGEREVPCTVEDPASR